MRVSWHSMLCVSVLGLSVPACALTPTGAWSFETPGPNVEDTSGNGLTGSAPTCARDAGRVGQALQLDGANGMHVPNSQWFRSERGFTVECWIRSDIDPGPAMNIISKPNEFMLRVDPLQAGGTISCYVWCAGGGWEPRARGPMLKKHQWVRLIASWDGRTIRFAVNQRRVSSQKAGTCPQTDAPLVVGAPLEGLAGFRGLIDEVRITNVPLGPIGLAKAAFGLDRPATEAGRREAAFTFDDGAEGWELRGEGRLEAGPDGVLEATLGAAESCLLVHGLAVETDGLACCDVRMRAAAGTRGVLVLAGDSFFKELPFALHADGRMHTYTVTCADAPWNGLLRSLGLYVDGTTTVTDIGLDGVVLAGATAAPADVRILSLAPERRINALSERVAVTCWIRNLGGPCPRARLHLSATAGIRVANDASRDTGELAPGATRTETWQVSAAQPLKGSVRVTLSYADAPELNMERPIWFSTAPESAAVQLARSRPWLQAGYPRSMDFRHLFADSVEFLEHNTVLLVDMVPGKIEAACEFKRRYPDRLVLMQVNDEPRGLWGSWHCVPREFALKEGLDCDRDVFPMPAFRGYWLLGPRTPLTADFPADSETCEVRIEDPEHFIAAVYGKRQFRDVLIYPLTDGQPDWRQAEYASVTDVSAARKTMTLRRWPTQAVGAWHPFRQGQAFIAPSAGSVYRLQEGSWIKTWVPNLTRFCPRDPETGQDAVTWWAQHFAALWHQRIAPSEPHPDGLQFDGLNEGRMGDCNNDGTLDACVIDGANLWRLGLYDFFRTLRSGAGFEGLGDGLLLADASNVWGPRWPALLNGSENEEFPSFAGPDLFTSGLDLYQVWCANSAAPVCPYLQGRFDCDTYLERGWDRARQAGKFHPDALVRLSIAAACMGKGIYTFRTGSRRDNATILEGAEVLEYSWDEFHAGRDGTYNWLGLPLEPPQRLTQHLGPDLLSTDLDTADWRTVTEGMHVRIAGPVEAADGDRPAVRITVDTRGMTGARGAQSARQALLLSPVSSEPLDPGREYAVSFGIRAAPDYGAKYRGTWRFLGLCLVNESRRGAEQWLLAGGERREVAMTLRPPSVGGKCRVAFLVGAEPGAVTIAGLELRHGCADVLTRQFEHGLALVNGSAVLPHAFDLPAAGGARRYRRFHGLQAPGINDGSAVGRTVTLPPSDGLLLKASPGT